MQNPDIFFEIVSRVNDATLYAFFLSPLRSAILKLLKMNDFWHRRAEYLVGIQLENRQGDWRRIYRALERAELSNDDTNKLLFGLDYLPSTLTIIEVYKPDGIKMKKLLGVTVDVLQYLIASNYTSFDTSDAIMMIQTDSYDGQEVYDVELIRFLLSRIADHPHDLSTQEHIMRQSILAQVSVLGREEVLDTLIELGMMGSVDTSSLYTAVSKSKNPARSLTLLMKHYPLDEATETATIEAMLSNDNVEGIKFFLEDESNIALLNYWLEFAIINHKPKIIQYLVARGAQPPANLDWETVLDAAIMQPRGSEMVVYIITSHPELMSSDILVKIARVNPRILEPVLRGMDIDPRPYITKILQPADPTRLSNILSKISLSVRPLPYSVGLDLVASVLMKSNYVHVESLTIPELRLVTHQLGERLHRPINGYNMGREVVLEESEHRPRIGLRLEEDSLYGLLLRFIFLKQPTDLQLMQWMRDQNRDEFILAARSIVNDASVTKLSSDVMIVRGLMLSLLYPSMKLYRAIDELKSEGMEDSELIETAQLIGCYRGLTRTWRDEISEESSEHTGDESSEETGDESSEETSNELSEETSD